MPRWALTTAMLFLALLLVACQGMGRHAPTGFRLPPGDAEAGKAAFVDLKCNGCHTVKGVEMPAPTATQVVELGGAKVLPPTDGDLTTDIILPNSHFATQWEGTGGKSPMPDYTRVVTIRQLADLVAFLQSTYGIGK